MPTASQISLLLLAFLAGANALLLALKAFAMAHDCFIAGRVSSAEDLSYDWFGTPLLKFFYLNKVFRFPLLVTSMVGFLAYASLPKWLLAAGAILIVLATWAQIVQAFVTRLTFGFLDIHVRQKSIAGSNAATPAGISQRENARALVLFIMGLATSIILGYAGVYRSLQLLLENQFSGTIPSDLSDCVYFSIVTFATVGYGDIAPLGIARLVTASEILSSMSCVVLLVLAYSMTASRDDA